MAEPKRGILAFFSSTIASRSTTNSAKSNEPGLSDEAELNSSSTVVAKRAQKRMFQESWKESFSWLLYDNDANVMKCKYCSADDGAAKSGSSFIHGCFQFKKESLRKHNDSNAHKIAMEHCLSKRKPKQIVSSFQKQSQKSDEKTINELKIKFNTAYAIAKEELPFTKFRALLQILRKNGLEMNEMYENDVKCAEIKHCISSTLKDELVNHLRDSEYFSVLIDAATDSSNKENEAVVVRYVSEGIPETKVLGLIELQHADAEGTLEAIKKAFLSADDEMLFRNHLVGFCSDGASVNFGMKSGVAKRLTDDCPWLIPIWCLPHRLELAVMDMLKKSDMGAKVIDVLHLIPSQNQDSIQSKRNPLVSTYRKSFEEPSASTTRKNQPGCRTILYCASAYGAFSGVFSKCRNQRNGCKTPAVLPEWKLMKVLVKGEFSDKTFTSLWRLFLTKEPYSDTYQNVLMLVKIMLCLPVSSAQCERTFSTMNRIKTDVRSSLNITTLEDLIRISREGPDILDFDPKSAVQKWLSTSRKVKLNYVGWPENCEDDD